MDLQLYFSCLYYSVTYLLNIDKYFHVLLASLNCIKLDWECIRIFDKYYKGYRRFGG
jgi:hypothetical protein